jgi:alpha-L-arabinofuranosidase
VSALKPGTLTTLCAENLNACNTVANPNVVVPTTVEVRPTDTVQSLTLPPSSFVVLRLGK